MVRWLYWKKKLTWVWFVWSVYYLHTTGKNHLLSWHSIFNPSCRIVTMSNPSWWRRTVQIYLRLVAARLWMQQVTPQLAIVVLSENWEKENTERFVSHYLVWVEMNFEPRLNHVGRELRVPLNFEHGWFIPLRYTQPYKKENDDRKTKHSTATCNRRWKGYASKHKKGYSSA